MSAAINTQPTALVYCRVSTKGQEQDGTSLESQEQRAVAHAQALGYSVGAVVREVYSGGELYDRPKLAEVRRDVADGRYQALVSYSTDRLSRDPIHLALIAEECTRADCALLFVLDPPEDSDEGRLILYVKGYSSKKEREKIRERSLRGKYQRAVNGKVHNLGPEKYGYRREVIAAELAREHEAGPDPTLARDLDTARREAARCQRKQSELMARYDPDNAAFPWELLEREVSRLHAEQERWQAQAEDLERRMADAGRSVAALESLYATCRDVAANLDTLTFDERVTALEGLEVRVTGDGHDWALSGRIPLVGFGPLAASSGARVVVSPTSSGWRWPASSRRVGPGRAAPRTCAGGSRQIADRPRSCL
jgi:DNA invertase Pin-like site-specific DNA recombinase